MKPYIILAISLLTLGLSAQNKNQKHIEKDKTMKQQISIIQDKMALKELVDVFSNLADIKDIDNQVLLFTENAIVESTSDGQTITLKGRKQIGDAFRAYLSLFDVVYHINGQQTVTLNGDSATATSYCQVILVGDNNGKRISNTRYVIYNDTYQKINGKWYIAHRKSNFVWDKIEEVK